MKNTDNNEDIFPIEKLIEVFEKAIPLYQKAVDENWKITKLNEMHMNFGICNYVIRKYKTDIYYVFDSYYKNYTSNVGFLFNAPYFYRKNIIENCIKPRLEFMKSEVIELKKLMKKGYTHV